MDLRDLARTLQRRWYLTLVAVICAIGVAALIFLRIGPTYSAQSTSVLIPPPTLIERQQASGSYAPANPLLYLSGLTDARDLVLRDLGSDDISQKLDAAFPGLSFVASSDPLTSGPLIVVTVEAKTQAAALGGSAAVRDQIPVTLNDAQSRLGVAISSRITSMPLTADKAPTLIRKTQIQATGMAGAGTLIVLLLVIALIDGLARDLRGRRRQTSAPVAAPAPVQWEFDDSKQPVVSGPVDPAGLPSHADAPAGGSVSAMPVSYGAATPTQQASSRPRSIR